MDEYTKQTNDFLEETGTTFKAHLESNGLYFDVDNETRDIFKITLKNKRGSYTFRFGQSIADTEKHIPPTAYNVLACLTKYDPVDFNNFCENYGYNIDSRNAEKAYKAVLKEWQNIKRIFSEEEINKLCDIN